MPGKALIQGAQAMAEVRLEQLGLGHQLAQQPRADLHNLGYVSAQAARRAVC